MSWDTHGTSIAHSTQGACDIHSTHITHIQYHMDIGNIHGNYRTYGNCTKFIVITRMKFKAQKRTHDTHGTTSTFITRSTSKHLKLAQKGNFSFPKKNQQICSEYCQWLPFNKLCRLLSIFNISFIRNQRTSNKIYAHHLKLSLIRNRTNVPFKNVHQTHANHLI